MAQNEKLEKAKAETSKKDKKAEKKDKPGFFARVGKWLKEMRSELKKVQWPTKKQVINNTFIVIACVVVVGIFIWLFDFIAQGAINLLLTLLR